MILANPEQIEQITGYRRPYRQERALVEDGVICRRNARGQVVVFLSELERVYGGGQTEESTGNREPDLSWAENE